MEIKIELDTNGGIIMLDNGHQIFQFSVEEMPSIINQLQTAFLEIKSLEEKPSNYYGGL